MVDFNAPSGNTSCAQHIQNRHIGCHMLFPYIILQASLNAGKTLQDEQEDYSPHVHIPTSFRSTIPVKGRFHQRKNTDMD